jgi:hypothetical protein
MPTSRAFEKLINGKRQAELTGLPTLSVNSQAAAIKALNARFGSFAATVQNRIDTDAGGPLTLTGSLDAQVQRALSQALRRGGSYQNQSVATLGSSASPATNLYSTASANPVGASMYTGGGYLATTDGYYAGGASTTSGMPAVAPVMTGLPPDQSVLVREAMITQQDLLSSLDALQALSVRVDPGDIQAYKNVIRAEVMTLTTEFARPDLPRPARVRVLLGGLLGWSFSADKSFPAVGSAVQAFGPPPTDGTPTGDVAALLYLLNLDRPTVARAYLDQQDALQAVVSADALRLLQLWIAFQFANASVPAMWPGVDTRLPGVGGSAAVGVAPPGSVTTNPPYPALPPPSPGTFSDRLIAANLLLPVVAEDAARVAGALDAIGFGPGQQETTPINGLQSDVDTDLFSGRIAKVPFPSEPVVRAQAVTGGSGPTIKDALDWAADLAGGASLDLIGQAGQLGLNLIADQADELFFILIAILKPPTGVSLPEALRDSQVDLELRSLARDLSELADQGI